MLMTGSSPAFRRECTDSLLSRVAAVGLFSFLAISNHSLAVVIALTSALLIGVSISQVPMRQLLLGALTWFAPFIVILIVVAFLQTSTQKALSLLTLVAIYFFARFVRASVSTSVLAAGMAMAALLIGVGYQLGMGSYFGPVSELEVIALRTDKNPVGWTIGFGFVGSVIAFAQTAGRRGPATAWALVTLALIVVLVLADSATPVIAILVLTSLIAVILLSRGLLKKPELVWQKAVTGIALAMTMLVGLVLLIQNMAGQVQVIDSGSTTILNRDFGTLTGRTRLWGCYLDAVSSNTPDSWSETVTCAGWAAAHLHNIFLESHLLGGFPLAIALFVGMALIGISQFTRALRAQATNEFLDALFAMGLIVVAFVVGFAESFITYELLFGTFAVFLSPPPARHVVFPTLKGFISRSKKH